MDKKGLEGQMIGLLVMILVLIGIVVVYFVASLVLPPITSSYSTVANEFQKASVGNDALANATQTTFGNTSVGLNNLSWISYTLFFVMLLGFLICAYFVKSQPFLLVFWILGIIVLIYASILMSSAYQDVTTSNPLYADYKTNNFFVERLPFIMSGFGFIGGFILFILATRDTQGEI